MMDYFMFPENKAGEYVADGLTWLYNQFQKAPLWLQSLIVAILLTGVSYLVGLAAGWITTVSIIEFLAVFTSYSCTYLCVKQSRLNYPIGMVSTGLLAYTFWTANLLGSALLNIYLVPTLIFGWFRWGKDSNPRPVTRLRDEPWHFIAAYAAVTAAAYAIVFMILTYFGASIALMDTAILVISMLAQFMLDMKKLENWGVWAVVNVISLYVYFTSGLFLVFFQFLFFLANTIWGWYSWNKSFKENQIAA